LKVIITPIEGKGDLYATTYKNSSDYEQVITTSLAAMPF